MSLGNRRNLVIAAAMFGLAACQTGKTVTVSVVPELEPVEIAFEDDLAPIGFGRAVYKIKRGTLIGQYTYVPFRCWPFSDNAYWNAGRLQVRQLEFKDTFYETMSALNFNIVGDPDDLFPSLQADRKKPSFLVSARIDDMKMRLCDHADMSLTHAYSKGTQSGSISMSVNWQVLDVINRNVVFQGDTQGYFSSDNGVIDGEIVLINGAFAAAARNLAANEEFVNLLLTRSPSVADIRAAEGIELEIDGQAQLSGRIADNIDRIRLGVVTLDSGLGHGSGFFVSPTIIMTNHHVVSGQKFIKVRLVTGREVLGEVVRSHAQRDVALVQVENAGFHPLPICSIPECDGAIMCHHLREELWERYSTAAPRRRTPSELRYSDQKL